jgi:hypothetical protein
MPSKYMVACVVWVVYTLVSKSISNTTRFTHTTQIQKAINPVQAYITGISDEIFNNKIIVE